MSKYAVVKTGGKQYLVKENDVITVDRMEEEVKKQIDLETLAYFDTDTNEIELGSPDLKKKVKAEVIEHLKGDKIRVAHFRAKVRYRKVKGFRASLTRIKIIKVN